MLDEPSTDPRALRDAFGSFATGVTVVTLRDGDGRATGVTVNSFSSLSLTPALCLFSLGRTQPSARWLTPGTAFAINVLAAEQEAIAWQFARPAEDKFAGVPAHDGTNGAPLIEGALAWFECRVHARYDGGDHEICVGAIGRFQTRPEGAPMLFFRGKMARIAP